MGFVVIFVRQEDVKHDVIPVYAVERQIRRKVVNASCNTICTAAFAASAFAFLQPKNIVPEYWSIAYEAVQIQATQFVYRIAIDEPALFRGIVAFAVV